MGDAIADDDDDDDVIFAINTRLNIGVKAKKKAVKKVTFL